MRVVDDLVQVQRLHFEVNLAGDDAAHVQQVVDDLRLRAHVALDGLEPARRGPRRSTSPLPQERRPALDRIQRRAQLVRQRREELILHVAQAFGLRARRALGLQELLALPGNLSELRFAIAQRAGTVRRCRWRWPPVPRCRRPDARHVR